MGSGSSSLPLVRVRRSGGPYWRAAVAETPGSRPYHEDAHFMQSHCGSDESAGDFAFFGVLDGHGGAACARLGSKHMPLVLSGLEMTADAQEESVEAGIVRAFVETDDILSAELSDGQFDSGSTCVAAGVAKASGGEHKCFIANAGDSRGVLVRRDGRTSQEIVRSQDHTPDKFEEQLRIKRAGGTVTATRHSAARLDGRLLMSRGLGNYFFKDKSKPPEDQKLTCVPELFFLNLKPRDLLILASDGIWDTIGTAALVKRLCAAATPGCDLGQLVLEVVRECDARSGASDNITLMLIEVGVEGEEPESNEVHGEWQSLALEQLRALPKAQRGRFQYFLNYSAEVGSMTPPEAHRVLGHLDSIDAKEKLWTWRSFASSLSSWRGDKAIVDQPVSPSPPAFVGAKQAWAE